MSPGAPGIGLFGIGIVLQNDAYGELRVIDIVSTVAATSSWLYTQDANPISVRRLRGNR